MSRPVLHVFAISHYCEKARWALDRHGVDYDLRHLAPGGHIQVAKQIGAPGTSVPLLVTDDGLVHGSSAIIDWAESACTDPSKRLDPAPELADECRAVEKRLDDVAGVHVRRSYYSEALVEYPETVLPIFTHDLAEAERESLESNWDLVRRLMIGAMDLGPEQGLESRRILAGELDWLDELLSDGRRHLVGDRLSRADITAASLLAPVARPAEHPSYGRLVIPPGVRAELESWGRRPIVGWVREMYRSHR